MRVSTLLRASLAKVASIDPVVALFGAIGGAALVGAPLAAGCSKGAGSTEGGHEIPHDPAPPASQPSSASAAIASARPDAGEALGPEPEIEVREGNLRYEVRDAETGALIPCKLTLLGASSSRTPILSLPDTPRNEGRAIAVANRIMSLTGQGVSRVPEGTYDVYVSRGPEWDMFVERGVRVGPRQAKITAKLRRFVDSKGWLSGDFHVHAASSFDSRVPMSARVFEFISDGVEMIVSTDHNVIADYEPIIEDLGVRKLLSSAMGDEITTASWGHYGAFPLPFEQDAPGGGAVRTRRRAPVDIFRDVREDAPDALIDVHHPRFDKRLGYFEVGRLDAAADSAKRPGFSFDFDAIEILNGMEDFDQKTVGEVMDDWFGLIKHGHLAAATGNSDTHHLSYNLGGYPRNYVRLEDDSPANATGAAVAAAVKQRHCFFTTGPFVEMSVGSTKIGDVAPAPDGKVRVEIKVQAAPWVSVSRVTLFVDGVIVQRWDVRESDAAVRLQDGHDIVVARDAFVVARVDGDKPLSPVVGDTGTYRVLPFAMTNPIFLDVDGNGRYDPPEPHGPHAPPAPDLKKISPKAIPPK